MKQLEIKTHDTIKFTEAEQLTYKHLIQMILNKAPMGGFSYKDNAIRSKIEKAVEDTKEGFPILFEDAEFDELQKLAKDMTWQFRSSFTNEFVDDLASAKSITPANLSDLKHSENGEAKMKKVK